jgi:hypothetical protein
MDHSSENAANGFGLLATGSSRLWAVDIDESLDRGDEWSVQLQGPQVYLAFRLRDLGVVAEVIRFLQVPQEPKEPLTLGTFGTAPVSLVWDNEDFPRCFLKVGPDDHSAMHFSLGREDIEMLLEALQQVAEDLPPGNPDSRA